MERVLVLGNAGAGKTHLAVALGARLGLEVVHLDRLFWKPRWTLRPRDEFVDILKPALPADGRWIADGNFVNTLDVRLPLADTAILLDLPTVTCVRRVVMRTITTTTRVDIAPGCEEQLFRRGYVDFLRYVANYRTRMLPRVLARFGEIEHSARLVMLRSRREIERFVAQTS